MVALKPWSWFGALLATVATVRAEAVKDDGVKSIPLRTHSLSVPYLDSQMQSRWWDFGGDTVIRTDTNGYVRLTGEIGSRAGWIFSRVPLTATNWEIEVEFKIEGTGTLYGDGMALWLTKERAQGGAVFGFKDKFEGLGIIIDTYKNDRPGVIFPYVLAVMGDGKTPYDKQHDGKANELAGCPAGYIRNNPSPTRLKITYYHDKELTVDIQHEPDKWQQCFSISNVKIPAVAYLGFSAETGELADNHDIVSVETRNLYSPEAGKGGAGQRAGPGGEGRAARKRRRKEGGGWGWWFFKFCMFGFVVVGAYVGFTAYRTQKSKSRF